MKKNVFTRKMTSEKSVFSILVNSVKWSAPSLCTILRGIFFELANMMPKINTEIGPLYPRFSDRPYRRNIKAREVKMVLGNFRIFSKMVDQITAPPNPTTSDIAIVAIRFVPINSMMVLCPDWNVFSMPRAIMILKTSVMADSTTRVDLVFSERSSILTMGTTTAGEMLPSTDPINIAGMSSIPIK